MSGVPEDFRQALGGGRGEVLPNRHVFQNNEANVQGPG